MNKAREWLRGKKTYLLLATGIIGVVVAWAEGAMSTQDALLTIIGAVAGITAKVGVTREIRKIVDDSEGEAK